jgi:hypothetical protein
MIAIMTEIHIITATTKPAIAESDLLRKKMN